jgi:hypothetical protein
VDIIISQFLEGSNSNNYVGIKQFLIQLIAVHSNINIRPTTWSLNFAPTNIYKNGLTFIALVKILKIQIDSNIAIEMHLVKKTTHIESQLYPILSKLESSHVIVFFAYHWIVIYLQSNFIMNQIFLAYCILLKVHLINKYHFIH